MKNRVALFVFVALAMSACSVAETKSTIGSPAPAFTGMTWVQGGPVEIKKGQVTVVEFWATWCPPCRATIPHLNALYQQQSTNGVAFVGISNEPAIKVKAFVDKMGDQMTYPVAIGSREVMEGYMGAFGVKGIPHAFVIDGNGKFAWHGHPMHPQGELEKAIAAALAKAGLSAPAVD
ncbi:MAG: TlpA family protein disulfide reductase [Kiritimatiellia bacterium]|jgi:thiol-disulfide isomerase/thioredoxin